MEADRTIWMTRLHFLFGQSPMCTSTILGEGVLIRKMPVSISKLEGFFPRASQDIWVMDDRDDSPERGEWNPDPEEDVRGTHVVAFLSFSRRVLVVQSG